MFKLFIFPFRICGFLGPEQGGQQEQRLSPLVFPHVRQQKLASPRRGGQSLVNVIFGGVSGMRMSVHMVLMSSEDGTLRWKPSRI